MTVRSTAILCIARNEQAFAQEWIQYHLDLGFDHIHFISTDDHYPSVHAIYSDLNFGSKVSLHHFNNFKHGWQINCYRHFSSLVKEDWLLILDLDEFLYLNPNTDIKSYLETFGEETGQIQFPWLNLVSNHYCHESTLDILQSARRYASNHVKSMVRCQNLQLAGIHWHRVGKADTVLSSGQGVQPNSYHETFVRNPSYYTQHPFIIHFCSRGHFDLMNRITGQKFWRQTNGKKECRRLREFLTGRPRWSNLPNRYLLLKVNQSLPEIEIEIPLTALNVKTDIDCLLDIFQNNIKTTVDFNCSNCSSVTKTFEERYALDYKLQLLYLNDLFDQEKYLQCTNQMEYVAKIRKQLEKINGERTLRFQLLQLLQRYKKF